MKLNILTITTALAGIAYPLQSHAFAGVGELSLFVSSIAILFASGIVSALFYIRYVYSRKMVRELHEHNTHNEQLVSSARGGYYYWDVRKNKEEFSLVLVRMLNFLAGVRTFEQLLTYFRSAEQEKLKQFFGELKVGRKNFFTHLKVHVRGHDRYLECTGDRVHDTDGSMSGIILWFHDVTDYIDQQNVLLAENEQLKLEMKSYSSVLNAAPLPVWKRRDDMSIAYCNLAYAKLAEESSEVSDAVGVPELHSESRALANWAKETHKPQTDRHHIIVNGKRRLFRIIEAPLLDSNSLVGFAQDITDLEKLEKEVERHVSAQSDLLESTSSATAIFGADTKLKFCNNAFGKLWGLDEKWLASKPTYGEILEVLREKRKLPEQTDFPKFKQEQLRWFTDLIEPHNDFFYLPDGTALRVIVIPHTLGGLLFAYEDMTDRLAFERSYNTLIAVQRATLDNLHEGVAVFGQNGRVTLSNPTYAKIWHLAQETLNKEPHISDILEMTKHLYNYGDNWDNFKNTLISQTMKRVTTLQRLERTDGSVLDVICVPLPDGASLMTYVDVTDSMLVERSLRERNEALEEADRLKTEFLANVSYELRSPLTSIVGFSEVLSKQYFGELNTRQQEYIDGIYKSSQYLMSLINDILDLASIEAGYMSLDIGRFDIYEALSSILPLIKERVKESGLLFNFECSPAMGKMVGDERRIKQMLFKLLSNAIKFTDAGGKIVLGARKGKKGEVVIWVEDNGSGIPAEEQLVVFDKFYKTDAAKSHSRSGAGLGLSVVKNFVTLHGGTIELQSKPGIGTRITCILPRDNPELRNLNPWKNEN